MLRFRRFQSRVTFLFLGLVSLVQVVVFATVDGTNRRHAREQVAVALDEGVRGFRRLVESRTAQLGESVRILTADFAFKSAIATNDVPTIQSVLQNHGSRVGADSMLLVSLEREPVADAAASPPRGLPPALLKLVETAEGRESAAASVAFDGKPYQMIVLPALAPLPVAWVLAGFEIDDRLARDLRQFTQLETSFLEVGGGAPRVLASSLDAAAREALSRALAQGMPQSDAAASMDVGGEEYVGRVVPLDGGVAALVQRSLARELQPFDELRNSVLLLSFGGLLLSVFGALFVARSVTRPVEALASAARGVAAGEYAGTVEANRPDELGDLARAFNAMVRGLAERDRVRNLLGKVVSPAIAEKLLSREVALGGEEREVTVLFSDLRDFTAHSETRSARETIDVLNLYFTKMSAVIEANHGVVDKYLGDGIMALFGAPVSHDDDAGNALCAALGMMQALDALNAELAQRDMPALGMGIGINTAFVIAGNLGSPQRLNYTVIGDGVNLAARLEGLTKREGMSAAIIAAEATLQRARRAFRTRALGPVVVRGRAEPVICHAVLGAP